MSRFLFGDELGSIKTIESSFTPQNPSAKVLYKSESPSNAVQTLSIAQVADTSIVAAGFSNGNSKAFSLQEDKLGCSHTWKETRLSAGEHYIGITISEQNIFSCTSNGALRLTKVSGYDSQISTQLGALPNHLRGWAMSPNQETFTYGGDEIDLSLWDTEQAFRQPSPKGSSNEGNKKRKRELFPGEIWRAKNVQPDYLGLRQPIRISCLMYLDQASSSGGLCVGTEFGDVRRYDTRAARRPVTSWKLSKVNGVKAIEKGQTEHELFFSDTSTNLQAVDLRTGGTIYSYKGISGSVGSLVSCPQGLASVASDRYIRFHSTVPPPEKVGQQQPEKGAIVDKVFVNAVPTVITWDPSFTNSLCKQQAGAESDVEGDDIWESMKKVDKDNELVSRKKRH